MNHKIIKARIVSIVAATAMLLTSVPAYAEELTDSVIETVETSSSDSENQSESNDNASVEQSGAEVVELTVTVTEVTQQFDVNTYDEVSDETPVETPADISQVADVPNSDAQDEILTPEMNTTPVTEVNSQGSETSKNNSETVSILEEKSEVIDEAPDINKGEKRNDAYQDLIDHQNPETGATTSTLNFTKVLSNFSVSQSSTGRYNAMFTIQETEETSGTVKYYNYTVSGFKTGELARAYAEAVQGKARYAGSETKYVVIDDNLIDAEKRPITSENENIENGDYADLYLCWAGSASNMLELSGWNKVIGHNYNNKAVSNEDELLDLYAKTFTNESGNPFFGIEWFFNAVNQTQTWSNWSHVKNSDDLYVNPMLKE